MKRFSRQLCVCLILLCVVSGLAAPGHGRAQGAGGTWTNHTVEYWTTALALQGDTMWVGTSAGLLRWDLSTDSTIKYTPVDGLVGFDIHDVALDDQGRVWVGHEWGLSVLDGSIWTTYDKDNGIPGDEVHQVKVASDGTVWLISRDRASGVGQGVTAFDGSTWHTYTKENSDLPTNQAVSIGLDHNDHLWVGTQYGDVAEFDGVDWTVYNDPTYNHNSIHVVGPDGLGQMWFTSFYNTYAPVLMFDGVYWHSYLPDNGCDGGVRRGAFDGNGKLWLTTSSGLCSYEGTTWTRYHSGNSGILDDLLEAIVAQGLKVWVGYGSTPDVEPVTFTEFDNGSWVHHHKARILPRGLGQGLAVDQQGRKWFGLMNKGVGMFDDETWMAYDDGNSGLPGTCTTIIAVDLAGHLWFAGDACLGGLVEYDGLTWTQHYGAGVPDSKVMAVAVDQANRVWAGSRQGLSYYDGATWSTYNTSNSGLPSNEVGSIVVDGEAHIWVECETRFDGSTWETYASPEAAIETYYDDIVDTFFHDFRCWVPDPARGKVWRGNSTSGVKAYNGSSWEYYSYTTMDLAHLYTWVAWPMGLDRAGNLWVVASDSIPRYGGVSRFDGTTWTGYRQADGLLEPPNFAMGADDRNHVWFTNASGLSEFHDPWQPTETTVTPETGGMLTSADGSTTVVFPAGAVLQDTVVTLTPLAPSPTGTLVGIDHFFDLTATTSQRSASPSADFEKPYSLTVNYASAELGTAIETTLGVYWWDGGRWILEPSSSVNAAANQVTASPDHMTPFAVLGETNRIYLPLVIRGA
jgi:ligand-binding sensor domain-containing protein